MLAAEKSIRISPLDFAHRPTIASLLEDRPEDSSLKVYNVPDTSPTGTIAGFPPFVLHFLTDRGEQHRNRWNISRMLVATKHLSAKTLENALKHMGETHDALRLIIFQEEKVWKGIVLETPDKTLEFRTVSLAGLSKEEKGRVIQETAADSQEGISLSDGPIAHMILFDSGENQPQELYFVIHHLMMDVISWKNFWFEFEQTYVTLEKGDKPSKPISAVSFKSWTKTFEQIATSDTTVADVKKCLQHSWQKTSEIPKDLDNDWITNTNSSAAVVTFALSEQETYSLLHIGSYGIDLESVLIGALAKSLSNWQSNRWVFFDRLVHGRNVALPGWDLSRTIGCLVSYAPTLLSVDASLPAGALISDIARQMETIDQLGTSVELFRYYGLDKDILTRTSDLPAARVMLNYRGNIDGVFDKSSLFRHAYHLPNLDHDPNGLRRYPIAVAVDLIEKCLTIKWVFSKRLHRKETIERLSDDFSRFLVSIINREVTFNDEQAP